MKSRLLPSASIIVALAAVAALLVATVGASNDGTKSAQREGGGASSAVCAPDHPDCDDMIVEPGGDVSNACIEGTVDCNDTIGVPVDGGPIRSDEGIDPNECNLVHNLDACSPEQLAGAGITVGAQPGVYDVGADFTADYTQADMERVQEIILSGDPSADVLVLERFPPAAGAHVHNKSEGFCEDIIAQLEAVHGVAGATCIPSSDEPPTDPDGPVSSEPSGSDGEKCAADAANCVEPSAPIACAPDMTECSSPGYDPGYIPAN